mmetsp:Transcript_644/g.871  ORF Transcript_644/g.871 Transcript_644/m.871 type:complete len:218 (-) Transcript_644:1063-1716(-)|eukprot:CAMPEP_0185573100 /NCGR_PEP_ID=MMETSP0434-20130131/4899_1 /TAXON_ID=626734 ORGANISM="Favella taraikaensis, Strain Fe Narragansett Bay" /NCGR_SAMPLE_ID=MMETSP0434 /ASSEMBLY_ACC=CAM_ASM_000379 /LENGTH=217 /DNA_ID=CAMNT_0028189225 /DNA_START=389 /DNA_END=1042 /DNA_ORIENTATION=+
MLVPHEDVSIDSKSVTSSRESITSSFFGFGRNRRNTRLNTSATAHGGINLANISYGDITNELIREVPEPDLVTVSEKMVKLNEVFYITDVVVVNKSLAGKLLKCNLEGSSLMVRSSKDKLYDSSEQIQIGQTKIMGFLDVDSLVALCKSTQWSTYKIWQAVKAGDMHYKPVLFVRAEMGLREALKLMILKSTKFAVVKKGHREIGMIGESLLREALG